MIALQKAIPRYVSQLGRDLRAIEQIAGLCIDSGSEELVQIGEQLDPCLELVEKIGRQLQSDPPAQLNKGNVIANGVSPELDALRDISTGGKDYLLNQIGRA